MSSDDAMVDERLSVFDDEPDLNDWFEVICGSLMAVIGIFQLISPGNLVDPDVMRWFAAAVVAAGHARGGGDVRWPSPRRMRWAQSVASSSR